MNTWKNWNLHTLLVGMQSEAGPLENHLAEPQKAKYITTIDPKIPFPRKGKQSPVPLHPKRKENALKYNRDKTKDRGIK